MDILYSRRSWNFFNLWKWRIIRFTAAENLETFIVLMIQVVPESHNV